MSNFDLIVLGGGSGGVACARRAAKYGARVALIEEKQMGGTCVHRGCIPKKLLVYASHFSNDFEDAAGYGWKVDGAKLDWEALLKAKNDELNRLENIYRDLLNESGVTILDGRGVFSDVHRVEVNGEFYCADTVLIATGGWPFIPDIPGRELAISSNEALELSSLPDRIVIVGGGYIACEFACIFNGLNVETILIHRSDMILRGFDRETCEVCFEEIKQSGVDFRLNTEVAEIKSIETGLSITTSSGEQIETDKILMATGRVPNTKDLHLKKVGVEINEKGAVLVGPDSKTTTSHIYAIGDCTDRVNLTPVAIHEGRCLAETIFNNNYQIPDYKNIPTAIFTQPEVGTVGMSEEEAKSNNSSVDIYKTRFRPLKHTLTGRSETIFMKLVVDSLSDRVLGGHMVGEGAGELSQLLGVAIKVGATKEQFDQTVAVHPTASEEFVTMYETAD